MKIHVQSELRRIEQTTPPGAARVQALTELGNRLVAAMEATSDLGERYRYGVMYRHLQRLAADAERGATP
jgi:hypothetical protein